MTISKYNNGNAEITLDSDGSRVINYQDTLELNYPLNLDIKVMSKCKFGLNPKTGKSFCSFCHESATTDGKECNYENLKSKLIDLPKGIELAIGCNDLTVELYNFLSWCYDQEYICNLTINQGHISRDLINIVSAIQDGYIKGLGISYRSELKWNIPKVILDYPNTVFHVIAGIDSINDVIQLKDKGVKKILVLGEKDFGFNLGKVNLDSRLHKEWFWWIGKLFNLFEVVSFDNLAIEQLNIKRFFTQNNWNTFNQGEYSFYIDAVTEEFSPSSRNPERTDWNNTTINKYFKQLIK